METRLISFLIVLLQVFQTIVVLADPKACFDALDKLPRKEIKNIYFMNFKEIAHTHPATDILICFLHASHPVDKSITEQYFDVYKKCDYFKERNFKPFGSQQLEELVSLGLPRNLEKDLREKMETGSKKQLEEGINHVQVVMSNEIELSSEFKYYKEFIARKLKPNQHQNVCYSNGIISSPRENMLEFLNTNVAFYS